MHRFLIHLKNHILLSSIALLLSFLTVCAEDKIPALIAKEQTVDLFSQPEQSGKPIAKLAKGEKLIPLANVLGGGQTWFMVRTQNGDIGWVRSSEVHGSENLESVFEEKAAAAPFGTTAESSLADPRELSAAVPVEMNGSVIIVPVVLNGSVKTRMMMDTGASYTVITPSLAKRLGVTPGSSVSLMTANGLISARLAQLKSLKVGRAEARALTVAVHNFSPDPRIQGLLGLNFLSQFHTSIDSRRQRLILNPR